MKLHFITVLLITFIFSECEEEAVPVQKAAAHNDTLTHTIVMNGNKCDTAYLYTLYEDPGVLIYTNPDGRMHCPDFVPVFDVVGSVNTWLPGIYFIIYNAKDERGKLLCTATRTIHVVKNNAGFLNGNYNVSCTCTAITRGIPAPFITTNTYVTSVSSGSRNNYFKIAMLKIGPEYLDVSAFLKGQSVDIEPGYYGQEYQISSSGTGTLSATKNSFTIDTRFYQYSPSTTNLCKNSYTKQLIIN